MAGRPDDLWSDFRSYEKSPDWFDRPAIVSGRPLQWGISRSPEYTTLNLPERAACAGNGHVVHLSDPTRHALSTARACIRPATCSALSLAGVPSGRSVLFSKPIRAHPPSP